MGETAKTQEETQPLDKDDGRTRLRAAHKNLNPLTKEEAEMIRKSITEARERSLGDYLSPRE